MYTGEKDRIAHINFVMSCIHRSTNQIYEHLIDREYEDLRKEISLLMKQLKDIKDSIDDD